MLWGIEFQVLTPWYKKNCCSFVLFTNGIVSMREVKLHVELECLKYWFTLHGSRLWYKS